MTQGLLWKGPAEGAMGGRNQSPGSTCRKGDGGGEGKVSLFGRPLAVAGEVRECQISISRGQPLPGVNRAGRGNLEN